VIAHSLTARKLEELALVDWNDEANVSATIRQELAAPRVVEIASADIVFADRIDFDLGGVRVTVEHVGGDHCEDACVMLVEPDALLFLGDCLCASPSEVLTVEHALPLYDRILSYPAERYVEGHHPSVTSRGEVEELIGKARAASRGDAASGDEDSEYFLKAFGYS
jgi:glyoxylase-like metal-dependent hydrolase (beta-lactamase superfamily II)